MMTAGPASGTASLQHEEDAGADRGADAEHHELEGAQVPLSSSPGWCLSWKMMGLRRLSCSDNVMVIPCSPSEQGRTRARPYCRTILPSDLDPSGPGAPAEGGAGRFLGSRDAPSAWGPPVTRQ